MKYQAPSATISAYTCPHCDVYAAHEISRNINIQYPTKAKNGGHIVMRSVRADDDGFVIHRCESCGGTIIYQNGTMVFPLAVTAPHPAEDMPEDIKEDYMEARLIANLSPRGACALLRLALQKLCIHLGLEGKSINGAIKELVSKGLHPSIQQALDSVRVTGNEAVHPGEMDLKDDVETASKLFGFLNIIVENQITQPKQIAEYYETKIPAGKRKGIEARDK